MAPSPLRRSATRPKFLQSIPDALKPRITSNGGRASPRAARQLGDMNACFLRSSSNTRQCRNPATRLARTLALQKSPSCRHHATARKRSGTGLFSMLGAVLVSERCGAVATLPHAPTCANSFQSIPVAPIALLSGGLSARLGVASKIAFVAVASRGRGI